MALPLPTTGTIPLADECVAVELKALAAITADGVSATFPGLDRFSGAVFHVHTTAITAGSVALFLQALMPDEVTWVDVIAFTSITAASDIVASFVNGGNQMFAATDATLAAGTFRTMLMTPNMRLKWDITTGPATFQVTAFFYR
jgi:hypothetical protein